MNTRQMATLVLAAAVAAGCATHRSVPVTTAHEVQAPVVQDLGSLADLAAAFDRDRGHPRLVLLLSPT